MTEKTTTRRRFALLVGGAALAGTAGCSGPGDASTPTDAEASPEATPTEQTEAPETTTPSPDESGGGAPVIAMRTDNEGSYFDPKGLLVEPGTTVRFRNDSGSHNTAAYHPDTGDVPHRIPEDAAAWDSELFSESGRTFEVTLSVPGVYDYYCRPHEVLGMAGRIVVGEPKGGPGTEPPESVPPSVGDSLPSVDAILEEGTVAGP